MIEPERQTDRRAVGFFDSGVGGLTVLHECLVNLPQEDYLYLGDTLNFPYGPKSLAEVRRLAFTAIDYLVEQDVKLIVVACNSAGAAALPQLQAAFSTPIIGVVIPGAWAAVQATRNRRVGLMATEATVRSNAYQRALQTLDAGLEVFPVACPRLAPLIQAGDVFSEETEDGGEGMRRSSQGGRSRHGDPGMHPLSTHNAHAQASPGTSGLAHRLGGGDRPRDQRHPGAQRHDERCAGRRRLSFRLHGGFRGVPRGGRPFPSIADPGGKETVSDNARPGGRGPAELRPLKLTPDFVSTADGSVFIELGGTRVLCSAQVVNGVPNWRRGSGSGWLTAEYSLLPSSTRERTPREAVRGRQDGRTVEIQRLIGRSLRAVLDLKALGERTIYIDCDVVEADGGTRCAAVTGAYLALHLALKRAVDARTLRALPLADSMAAVSVGVVDGLPVVDLEYEEDCRAEVDMNVVTTGSGRIIEVQATAESVPFERVVLDQMLDLATSAIDLLTAAQMEVVARAYVGGDEVRR